MPTGYVLLAYWGLVALGGALFLGTGAALVRYARTGRLPGHTAESSQAPTRMALRGAVLRCGAGLALAAAGLAGLVRTGG